MFDDTPAGIDVEIVDSYPTRGMFRPGAAVELMLELTCVAGSEVEATAEVQLTHLTEPVGRLEKPITLSPGDSSAVRFRWQAPQVRLRGYGADLALRDADGRVLATASTAFDVGEHWTTAPRYGFVCDFSPGRHDTSAALRQLAKYHVNGLQFYDWQYRHDHLLPPADTFTDPLGRPLSLATVQSLIEAAHRHGMAAMPYTAIYAASPAFAQAHPDWALYDSAGVPCDFDNGFLSIMNPTADSPWTEHLMAEFAAVLHATDFDGIHLDQYGDPKAGYAADGQEVDLAHALPGFIRRAKATASAARPDAVVIFNAVGNWPIETVASAPQDVVYIEVWPPDTSYADLWRLIADAQVLSGGKPVVLAAYIDPGRPRNVRLADAVIFASGGYHIELGEGTGMLADPYFPKYRPVAAELASVLRRYYDFAVRYEDVLAARTTDITPEVAARLSIAGIETSHERLADSVWPIARRGHGFEAISLVNLTGVENPQWTEALPTDPVPLAELRVHYQTVRSVHCVWWASPDYASPRLAPLKFEPTPRGIAFAVPHLAYWDLVVIEYAT